MQIDSRIVKRLGLGAGISALIIAGSLAGRAAPTPEPVYMVAPDVVAGENALRAAIDPLFDDEAMGQTRALLVMRDGNIVAERYAPGFGPDTKLLAWSMAKTVTGVLAGLMVADGRLALDAPVPVPAWSQPGDPRGKITLRQLLTMSSGIDHVEAEVMPEGKLAAVEALRARGSVAFVGDGINDAPALAAADVGIAMGGGTEVAIESAEVVLSSGRIGAAVDALAVSRRVMRNIRQNLGWAFGYNVALIPVAAGALYPWNGMLLSPVLAAAAMSASSVLVLSNALRLRSMTSVMGETA